MPDTVTCLIIDDEPLAITLMETHIAKIPQLKVVAACQNPIEAFEILKKEKIDLLFLDIQMPLMTGIDFVKSLQHVPSIIFTTAYREYAVESYELEVVDYLLKPISFTRFFKAINKFLNSRQPTLSNTTIEETQTEASEFMFVNANKKHIKILFDDILYVESIKNYVRIHTKDQRIVTKDKISDFEKKLPPPFLRIHRSFIVNTQQISAFTAHDIEIGQIEIPIGGSYKQKVFEWLKSS